VYALEGVDAERIVVMKLDPGDEAQYILFSVGDIVDEPGVCRHAAPGNRD
jgi:hypothetical protein